MEYILPSILVLISYFLGTYFAFQGLRSPIERPIIYNESSLLFFTILFGWVPIILAGYLVYKAENLYFVIVLILIRFVVLPLVLNKKMENFMNKRGF